MWKMIPEQGSPDYRPGPERVEREQCAGNENNPKCELCKGQLSRARWALCVKDFRQPFPPGLIVLSGPSGDVVGKLRLFYLQLKPEELAYRYVKTKHCFLHNEAEQSSSSLSL
jgi:hypothetical protein